MRLKKIFLLLPIFALTSCSFLSTSSPWEDKVNASSSFSFKSNKLSSFKTTFDVNSFENSQLAVKNIIAQKGLADDFNKYLRQFTSFYYNLLDCIVIESVNYYANPENATISANKNRLFDAYYDALDFIASLNELCYNSSPEIKKAYFGNTSEEEILKIIEKSKNQEEITVLQNNISDIEDSMENLYVEYAVDRKITANQFTDKTIDLYLSLINYGNSLAKLKGYDNYLEFSYKETYSRDYDVEDALDLVSYIKDHFVPLNSYKNSISQPSNFNSKLYTALANYNLCNVSSNIWKSFDSYANSMDESYLNSYNHLWKYGYYCFTDNESSFGTAYIDSLFSYSDQVAYFSSQNQNILSVVHEFGHYYALHTNSRNRSRSFDILETHSQGNEFVFLNYLLDEKKDDFNYSTYKYFADNNFYDMLFYIINEALITEIEQYAFTVSNINKTKLKNKITEIISSYGGAGSETYWCYPCVASSCYYISYATSAIASMQFYAMPLDQAKTVYTNFCSDKSSSSTEELWENNNIISPFEEEACVYLESFTRKNILN